MGRLLRIPEKLKSVGAVFGTIVLMQVALATLRIDILSSVRAYVSGESLYSKGQKDALLHVQSYLGSHSESDYQQFLAALAVPEGDAKARQALQQPVPDREAARDGFIAGLNNPDDVPGLIRLFVWAQDVPFMARALTELALLPAAAVFWIGFALPIPPVAAVARVALIAAGWSALR